MRFPTAALFLLVASFIFFVMWAVSSMFLGEVAAAMMPHAERLSTDNAAYIIGMIPWAFGIICAVFFFLGIIAVFVLDSLADESEYYYR